MGDTATVADHSLAESTVADGASFLERLRQEHVKAHPFGEPTYWDERYENNRREHGQNYHFDWYVDPDKIESVLGLHCGEHKGVKILVVGCGNSKLSKVMYDAGYRGITSIDTSTVVVSQMQYRYKDCEGMDFMVGDIMKLDMFADSCFDAIIDKGCLDCIFCSYNSIDNAHAAYKESCRLLKPGKGKLISITYGNHDTRCAHMRLQKWDVELGQVPYSHGISLIVATKFPDATNKGKLKAAMKYGALFGKNTAKDKWAAPESKKHSSLTKNKDKIGKQSLQGLVLLTPEQEADLELDPEKGFSFGEVEGDLEKGQIEGEEMTAKIQAEKNEELAAIIRTDGKMEEIDDVTDIADLGSVLKTAIGRKHDEKDAAAGKPVVKRSQSAVWGLAKKSMAATKGVVAEGDRDAEVIDDAEFERLQNA